ncbi:MAG: hypothetical protein GYB32_14470 [Algicola sp.]|nr:hypothetical protein [Algicola sp.]
MKYFTIIATIIAVALVAYNSTKLDFENLFEGQSIIALITILAALCAVGLLQLLRLSKRVDQKSKEK